MGIFGNNDLNQSGTSTGTTTGTTTGLTNGTTSGTTSVSPYKFASPLLNKLLSDAGSFYKQGNLDPYTGLSPSTKRGLGGLTQYSMLGVSPLRQALNTYSSFAGGGNAVGTGAQQGIYGKALAPSYSENNLAGIAKGDLLNRTDPNFERVLGSASEKAATAARMAAGAKGRYGGDYAQTEVGRTVGDLQAEARLGQYNTERQNQVQANSIMDQMRQAGLGLGLNAANSKTAIEADNKNRMLSGAAGVPGAFQASLEPFRELLKVGNIRENDQHNAASTHSNNLASLAQILGIANPYGTTNTTGTTTGVTTGSQTGSQTGTTTGLTEGPDNTLTQGLGLGLGGLSLVKALKDMGGIGNLFSGLF